MKSKEELNTLKEEVETLNQKLAELTEEELAQVSGGDGSEYKPRGRYMANVNDTPTVSPGDCKHCGSYYRTCKLLSYEEKESLKNERRQR